MNLFIAILLTIVGGVGMYFTLKNLTKIYDIMESNMLSRVGWLLRVGILLDVLITTAGLGMLFTGVPVLEIVMPFASFGLGSWFLIINPTRTKGKKA
jgi:hypothetical protein